MSRTSFHLTLTGSGLVAEHRNGRGVLWAATAEFNGPAELAEAVAGLTQLEGAPRDRQVWVRVEAPYLQVRRLDTLPPVRSGQLTELVATQPGRYFRKNGKPLVTAAGWLPGGRRTAVLVALEEPYAGALLAGAESAGLEIVDILPAIAEMKPRLSLLPTSELAARRGRIDRWLTRGAICAAALWVGLAAITYLRSSRELALLQAELDTLRAPVSAILVARNEMEAAAAGIAAVEAPISERLAPAFALAGAVQALPDSAWLTTFSIGRQGAGRLEGAAPRPAVLLARLERSAALVGVRPDGRSVSEVIAGRQVERFSIRFGREEGR